MSVNKSLCSNATFLSLSKVDFNIVTHSFVVTLVVIINAAAVMFNIIVITRILRLSQYKLFTRYFLVSLASADLLLGLTIMPFSIYGMFHDTRTLLGARSCDIANSFDVMASVLSITSLSVLAFDRFIAICKPFHYDDLCNKASMVGLSLGSCTIALVVSFGLIMPGYHNRGVEFISTCFAELKQNCVFVVNPYYATLTSTFTIFLPGVCIVAFNITVMRRVQQCKKLVADMHVGRRRAVEARSLRVARTITALTACFLACWLPFNICYVVDVHTEYVMPYYIFMLAVWLGYTNSALNPILYLLLESKSCIGRS